MKFMAFTIFALAMPLSAFAQAEKVFPVTLISQVKEANTRVTALAIDFGKPLSLNWTLASAFSVNAELRPVTSYEGKGIGASMVPAAPRSILRAYTSDRPDISTPREGQYVIIEMDADDFNASSWYMGYNPGFRQILPYDDAMIYDVDLLHDLAFAPEVSAPMEPAAEVATIPADAAFEVTETRIRTADDFEQAVYAQPENADITEISYNFHLAGTDEKAPLVVFLHGSGQSHDTTNHPDDISADTRAPLITNQGGVVWIERGKGPVFVLVPQAPARDVRDATGEGGWRSKDAYSLLVGLIDQFVEAHPTIDRDRIYLAGLSMGAIGSWKLLTDPDEAVSGRFAAALLMNGMSTNSYNLPKDAGAKRAAAATLMKEMSYDALSVPLWLTHSDTDPVVNVDGSRVPFAILSGSTIDGEDLTPAEGVTITAGDLEVLHTATSLATGKEVRYTEYLYGDGAAMLDLGMMTPNAHFSWEVSFKDQDIIDWVFAQSKE